MPSATISEIYDLSTDVNKGTVLKIHAPGGNNIKRHLAGFFMQYKQFKYHGCKVTLVPASTLPADPLQLGYEAGEPTIDPRDMVNPILYRWYHGEAMLTDQLTFVEKDPINGDGASTAPYQDKDYIGSSVDQQDYFQMVGNPAGAPEYPYSDAIYANCLMDPSFKKAGIQAGFSTFCRPYCYNIVTNQQYLPNRKVGITGVIPGSFEPQDGDVHSHFISGKGEPRHSYQTHDEISGQFLEYLKQDSGVLFTNKLQLLGWMDTVTRQFNFDSDVLGNVSNGIAVQGGSDFFIGNLNQIGSGGSLSLQTFLPDIQMLYILMSPAYKTRFYFRLILKHYFSFRGFRSCFNVQSYGSASVNPLIPLNAVDPQTLATGLASYLEESASGGPDSVTVENGSIINAADGVTG